MIGALDVLVVDDRPDTVRFLTEFLLQRCRRVDVASSAKEAMSAVTKRRAGGETYDLIFSDLVMPGADGLSFLRELRLRNEQIPFAFITGYRSLNPALEIEAGKLGVLAILDKPIELREVENLMNGLTARIQKKKDEKQGGQPFFGTSRILRRSSEPQMNSPAQPSEALEPRLPPVVAPAAAPADAPPPPVGNQRRPSAITAMTPLVRSGGEPGAPASPQPITSFTARVRRGVEGTATFQKNAATRTENGKMVSCTNCGRSFLTLSKPEAYTTLCVHCGQMQRIDVS